MENNDLLSPQLQVDTVTSSHLIETAKWAKFLAIVGFVGCVLIVLFGLFFGTIMGALSRYGRSGISSAYSSGMAVGMAFVYIVFALLYFFPCLYLYRFATQMKMALQSGDQTTLNESLSNLRRVYKFFGILTIIVLAFYALAFIFGGIGIGLLS